MTMTEKEARREQARRHDAYFQRADSPLKIPMWVQALVMLVAHTSFSILLLWWIVSWFL